MSTGSRQRKTPQSKTVRDDDDQLQPGEEEPSVIKGLLPCIFGILGVAFSIWLVVYFYLPPQSNDQGLNRVCTQIENLPTLHSALHSVRKWEELGKALRIDQSVSDLSQFQVDEESEQDGTKRVLRAWFESKREPCWEEVIRSLQEIGMQALANQLALKYQY